MTPERYRFYGATRLPLSVEEIIKLAANADFRSPTEDYAFCLDVKEFRRLLDSHEMLRAAANLPRLTIPG